MRHIVLFAILIIFQQRINAQEDSTTFNEVITFHPFHLVNNGIRIDYDRRISKNHWIQIGPQFYASERSEDKIFRDYKELLGVGISVFHRMYVGKRKPSLGTYFSYGFTFNHFNLKYDYDDPVDRKLPGETSINKFGGDIIIGYQTVIFDRLILDFYTGLGGRYSNRSYKGDDHRKFNEFLYDYGFTGNVLLAGIRIGFGF